MYFFQHSRVQQHFSKLFVSMFKYRYLVATFSHSHNIHYKFSIVHYIILLCSVFGELGIIYVSLDVIIGQGEVKVLQPPTFTSNL